MLKQLILIAGIFSAAAAFSQTPDCKKFKNGTFRIIDGTGNTTLIRKGSKQTEIVDLTGEKYVFKVKWIDDCTYTLGSVKNSGKTKKGEAMDKMVVTVKIVEVKENSYVIEATSDSFGKVYRNEVIKVK